MTSSRVHHVTPRAQRISWKTRPVKELQLRLRSKADVQSIDKFASFGPVLFFFIFFFNLLFCCTALTISRRRLSPPLGLPYQLFSLMTHATTVSDSLPINVASDIKFAVFAADNEAAIHLLETIQCKSSPPTLESNESAIGYQLSIPFVR